MGTEILKIEEEITEKMKPKVANPLSKIGQGIDTSGQLYKTTFSFLSTNVWNKFCFHCKS